MNRDQAQHLAGLVLDISEASSECGDTRRTWENLEKVLPGGYVKSRDAVVDEVHKKWNDAQAYRAKCWEIYYSYVKELMKNPQSPLDNSSSTS